MNAAADDIVLDNGRVRLRVTVVDGIARLAELVPSHWAGADKPPSAMPLVEVSTSHVGSGGRRHSERNATRGLQFQSAETTRVPLVPVPRQPSNYASCLPTPTLVFASNHSPHCSTAQPSSGHGPG